MVSTDYGMSGAILAWCGSANPPWYLALGSGSGASVVTRSGLIAEVLSSRRLYTTRDIGTAKKVTLTFDYGSSTMSGINLREIAACGSEAKNATDPWSIDSFPAITFDG